MNKEGYAFTYDLILDEKRILGDLLFLKKYLQTQLQAKSEDKSTYHIINQKILSLEKNFYHSSKLLRDLMEQIYEENKVSSKIIIENVKEVIEVSEFLADRKIRLDIESEEVKLDAEIVDQLFPVVSKILKTLLEYTIESPKERFVRGKREEILFKISLKEEIDSLRLFVFCDGNGLEPPFLNEHAALLAERQILSNFEGRPGKCSAWIFHIPKSTRSLRVINFYCSRKILAIPMNLVFDHGVVDKNWVQKNQKFLTFNEENYLFQYSNTKKTSHFENISDKSWIKIGIGNKTAHILVDEVLSQEEVYLRPLSEELNPEKRFLGVALSNLTDSYETGTGTDLVLVLNIEKHLYPTDLTIKPKESFEAALGGIIK